MLLLKFNEIKQKHKHNNFVAPSLKQNTVESSFNYWQTFLQPYTTMFQQQSQFNIKQQYFYQRMEDYYEVKRLIDYKIENNQEQVKVEWVGYSKDQSTWEPVRNLRCPDENYKQLQKLKAFYFVKLQKIKRKRERIIERKNNCSLRNEKFDMQLQLKLNQQISKPYFFKKLQKRLKNCLQRDTSLRQDSIKVQQEQTQQKKGFYQQMMYYKFVKYIIQNEIPNRLTLKDRLIHSNIKLQIENRFTRPEDELQQNRNSFETIMISIPIIDSGSSETQKIMNSKKKMKDNKRK